MKRTIKIIGLLFCVSILFTGCGNSRAEEAVQAYEKIADELVEARANGDFQRQMEIAVELRTMQVEYADIKADEDLDDDQRKRLKVVMQKIIAGGYDDMLKNISGQ